MSKFRNCLLVLFLAVGTRLPADVVTFDGLPVNANGFYNGDPDVPAGSNLRDNYTVVGTGPDGFGNTTFDQRWTSGGLTFNNEYTNDPNFPSWSGWSWSEVEDTTTAGFGNQYAAITGGGASPVDASTIPGNTYLVAFADDAFFNLPTGAMIESLDVTNTTYAALSMANGDAFTDPFGGPGGDEPDLFQVTFTGYSEIEMGGSSVGSVTVDLADYRFDDNSNDYILTNWMRTDLTSLVGAQSVGISFSSTDTGPFGINTPTYIAVDNVAFASAVPEPGTFGAILIGGCCAGWIGIRRRRKTEGASSRQRETRAGSGA